MTGRVIVEADGGSRGNPVRPGTERWYATPTPGSCSRRGRRDGHEHQQRGRVLGAHRRAARRSSRKVLSPVEARLDSKLVVEQMSGRWQVKQPHLRPLASEAAELARQLGDVRYTWMPRARNKHADRLANEAMDARPAAQPSFGADCATVALDGATGTPTRLLMVRHG